MNADLQTIFYIIGILVLSLWLILTISFLIIAVIIYRKIIVARKNLTYRILELARLSKMEILGRVINTASSYFINRIRKMFRE